MNYKFLLPISASLFSFFVFSQNTLAEDISVRIQDTIGDPTKLAFKTEGDFTYNIDGQKIKSSNERFSLSVQKGKLVLVNGSGVKRTVKSTLNFSPVVENRYSSLNITNSKNTTYKYLGDTSFSVEKGTIQPINTLDVELYLLGVVTHEMPASWHPEALKSQAVAARTYTYARLKNKSFNDTVSFQVYRGYDGNAKAYNAVKGTLGKVVMYKGNFAETWYSSSNGGYISSSKDNGMNALPYLISKKDPYDPNNSYTTTVSEKDIIKAIKKIKGFTPEKIISVSLPAKNQSGRHSTINFKLEDNQIVKIDAIKFRSAIGTSKIRSTMFSSVSYKDTVLHLKTNGYGHGVGMSQYGANSMAQKDKNYYDILKFYYPNTQITQKATKSSLDNKVASNKLSTTTTQKKTTTTKKATSTSKSATTAKTISYKVVKGDTLSKIARKHKVSVANLKKWNNLKTDTIKPNQLIKIQKNVVTTNSKATDQKTSSLSTPKKATTTSKPMTSAKTISYKVVKGDTLSKIARKHNVSVANLKKWNNLKTDTIKPNQLIKIQKNTASTTAKAITKKAVATSYKVVTKQKNSSVNFRSSASTKGKIISTIKNGTTISFVSNSGAFVKVKYKNKVGFISKDFVKKITT